MDLFQFSDYRKVLDALIECSPTKIRRGDLARAAGCSSSWMTRVFDGSVQMTLDQLLGVATYFHLNEIETDYLLGLLEYERAATILLKTRIKSKLDGIKKEATELRIPVKGETNLSESDSIKYYSSWYFAAIHVATMMQKISVFELAEKFGLAEVSIQNVLSELESMGLVQAQSGKWQATALNFHLPAKSPLAKMGHVNWRNRTINHLQNPSSEGLHYSGPHCLSFKDISVVSEKLKAALMECRQIIEDSPADTMAVLCLDWYRLD